jgi:uncharacterized membrane protein YhaH (DUF805 family)
MNFKDAIVSCLKNYVTFSGRALRSEFWYWILFCFIVSIVAGILDMAIFPDSETAGPLQAIFGVLTLLPNLAVGARRLHDIDRTGWWQLIAFTIIGIILLIYWFCKAGEPGTNRFGGPAPTTA